MATLSMMRSKAFDAADAVGNRLLSPPLGGGFGQFVNHGPRSKRSIAFTFDDGPSIGGTDEVVAALAASGAPGTFFCVGDNLRANAELAREMDAAGHVIGNHSQSHRRGDSLRLFSRPALDASTQQFADVLGKRPRLYRPPWGWLTPWHGRRLHRAGYTIVGWDVYTLDWQESPPTPESIAQSIVDQAQPGSIVLLHDGRPGEPNFAKQVTGAALRIALPELAAQGYSFETVADLLGVAAYE
jgi:peptidoglycan-N-acetylglucosamine deacetylase